MRLGCALVVAAAFIQVGCVAMSLYRVPTGSTAWHTENVLRLAPVMADRTARRASG